MTDLKKKAYKPGDVPINEITFCRMRDQLKGGRIVPVSRDDRPIYLSFIALAPWGIKRWIKNPNSAFTIGLSFRGMEEDKELGDVFRFMNEFSNAAISQAVKQSKEWFRGKKLTRSQVTAMWHHPVRYSFDKEGNRLDFPPIVRAKLQEETQAFIEDQCVILKADNYDEHVFNGTRVKVVIQMMPLWFQPGNHRFGLSFRLKQVRILPRIRHWDRPLFADE